MLPIRVGIGGWNFAPWRGRFYPPGLPADHELAYASTSLTSIEINGTFYRHQAPDTFAAWRRATPAGFVFAVKAHRATTQSRDTAAAGPAIERFIHAGLEELGEKLGPILWQFAPTKQFSRDLLEPFLAALPESLNGQRLLHAIEARHPSFDNPAWIALARMHGVAVAMIDSDKQALRGDVTGPFIYARLQRNSAAAAEGYDTEALDKWAARFGQFASGAAPEDLPITAQAAEAVERPCYVYFISGDKERAPDAAMAMLRRLEPREQRSG